MVDVDSVAPRAEFAIECEASDDELLFVAWLNALLAEADIGGVLFSEFEVEIADGRLTGRARGEPFDPSRHVPGVEAKGATLTELDVARRDGRWIARTVVDV
jgi:SHS2 domain-containing protein